MTRHLTVVRPAPRPAKQCGHWLGQHKRDCDVNTNPASDPSAVLS